MSEHEKIDLDLLKIDEDEPFHAFLILRAIMISKKKKQVTSEEINLIYKNYVFLLIERKQMQEYKKRLEAVNNFVGLA